MEKPCTTDKFLRVILEELEPEQDYDDHRITDAVIAWNKGLYIEAVSECSDETVREIFGDTVKIEIVEHAISNVYSRFRREITEVTE